MSKYRCPRCGAPHKQMQEHCRLCGERMGPEGFSSVPVQPKVVSTRSGSLKGVFLIGFIAVVLIAVGALVLGYVQSNKAIDLAVEKIPGVGAERGDGWNAFTDDELGMAAELPGDRTKENIAFPAVEGEEATVWTATIGTDTTIHVGRAIPVDPPAADADLNTQQQYLRTVAEAWATQNDVEINSTTVKETTFGGLPAVVVNAPARTFTNENQDAYGQLMVARYGDQLYVIEVISVYKDAEQFGRVANGLTPIAPSASTS